MTDGAAPGTDERGERPRFRRATEADALAEARAVFLGDERVDLNTLARRLGVSRATLHRWIGTREQLLDQILEQLAGEYLEAALVHARARPDDAVAELAQALVTASAGSPPLRGFVVREPQLALRLLLGDDSAARRRVRTGVAELTQSVYPDEVAQLEGFVDALVETGFALVWATVAAGSEPSAERVAQITRALLAGARAGELPALGQT